jgi:hypothetical protein
MRAAASDRIKLVWWNGPAGDEQKRTEVEKMGG